MNTQYVTRLRRKRENLEWEIKWKKQGLVGRKRTCPTSIEIYDSIASAISRMENEVKAIDLELIILGVNHEKEKSR